MAESFEYRPLSELPDDADPSMEGSMRRFSFGTDVFGGSDEWIIVENNTSPLRLYKLPPPVSRMFHYLSKARFDAGRRDAQDAMQRALGLG